MAGFFHQRSRIEYPEMTPKDSKIHENAAGVKVLFSFFVAISSKYREEYMYIKALKCRRHGNFFIVWRKESSFDSIYRGCIHIWHILVTTRRARSITDENSIFRKM